MRSIALILILAFPSFAKAGIIEGIVVNVADGDTITVLDSDKQQHRARMAGIDAPEKGQAFGNASRKRLGELVARKDVRVEFQKRDRISAREQSVEDLGRYEFAEEAKAREAG